MEEQVCIKCGRAKPLAAFHKAAHHKSGVTGICRSCDSVRSKQYYADHRAEVLARIKAYRDAHPEKVKAYQDSHKEQSRDWFLKKHYGIGMEEYQSLLVFQNRLCAVCGSPTTRDIKKKAFFVDHDHTTGEVRGLVCGPCNQRLGVLDKTDWRVRAERYLKDPPARRWKESR